MDNKELRKRTLELEKEVKQFRKKWTIIYLLFAGFYIPVIGILLYKGWWIISLPAFSGLLMVVWGLSRTTTIYECQMDSIKRIKRMDNDIVKEKKEIEKLEKEKWIKN